MDDFLNLLSASRMRIVQFVKSRGTVTVDETVNGLGLAETTIRQHFDRLEEKGLMEHESVPMGPGRPTSQYRLTGAGRALFPNQDERLLGEVLDFMLREGYPGLVDQFFQETWAKRRDEIIARFEAAKAETIVQKLEVLEAFLHEQGFMPEIDVDGDQVAIRECNCPFPAAVRATRLPCRLEAQLFEQLLGRDLSRVGFMPDGEPACVYEFDLGDAPDTPDTPGEAAG